MAIIFTNTPGALFNILGRLGSLIKEAKTDQTAQETNALAAIAQLDAMPDIQATLGATYIGMLNGIGGAAGNFAQSVAAAVVNRIVFDDNPQISQNLQSVNITASWNEVIRQMRQQNATILAMTIGSSTTAFVGAGTGAVVVGTRRPSDGLVLENAYAETITLTCTTDSYTGGATAGSEGFRATGQGSAPGNFSFDWPLGSNAQINLNAIDGNVDNGSGNLLTNSSFAAWTSNVPDNFTLAAGTAGTHIAQESTLVLAGSTYAVRLIGDGATNVSLTQQFDDSAGTTDAIAPLTQVAVNVFVRRDGVAASQGVLTIDLVDGNGDVIEDEGGTPNSFDIDLTALTVNYTPYGGTFRTPRVLPAAYYLRLRQSTPLESGRSVYLDRLGCGLATQFYTAGPYLAVFSGGVNFQQGDYATATITNARGAAGTLSTFQTLIARLFPALAFNDGMLVPSASTPSISDGLIV